MVQIWASWAVTFISIILSIIFFYRSRPRKKIKYYVRGYTPVNRKISSFPDLIISYHGREVNTLSLSEILIINVGNQTIEATDIVATDPIRLIVPEGADILEVKKVLDDHPGMGAVILREGGHWQVHFNFIERRSGFLLRLIHTSNDAGDVFLSGYVKDGGRPLKSTLKYRRLNLSIFGTFFLTAFIMYPWVYYIERFNLPVFYRLLSAFILGSVAGWAISRVVLWWERQFYPRSFVYFAWERIDVRPKGDS